MPGHRRDRLTPRHGSRGARQSHARGPEPERFPDHDWWAAFDPATLPTCARCSFLPVCWGGCPKRHLDGTQAERDAEGRYWRHNLPRLIAEGLHERLPDGFAFTAGDQFRTPAEP